MDQNNTSCFEGENENIENDFDGVASDSSRAAPAAPTQVASFGLPLDLAGVDVVNRGSDEFESMPPVTRGLTDVAKGPSDSICGGMDSLELVPGVGFAASASLFDNSAAEHNAPLLPFYLRPSPTSFRSTKPLARICRELEEAWSSLDVTTSPDETGRSPATVWECTHGSCEFEARVFDCGDSMHHLVEVRPMGGCRFAFSGVAGSLAQHLSVAYMGFGTQGGEASTFCAVPSKPLALPAGLEKPALLRCSS